MKRITQIMTDTDLSYKTVKRAADKLQLTKHFTTKNGKRYIEFDEADCVKLYGYLKHKKPRQYSRVDVDAGKRRFTDAIKTMYRNTDISMGLRYV